MPVDRGHGENSGQVVGNFNDSEALLADGDFDARFSSVVRIGVEGNGLHRAGDLNVGDCAL